MSLTFADGDTVYYRWQSHLHSSNELKNVISIWETKYKKSSTFFLLLQLKFFKEKIEIFRFFLKGGGREEGGIFYNFAPAVKIP